MIVTHGGLLHPRIGRTIGLGRCNIDADSLKMTLTCHRQEKVDSAWQQSEVEYPLVRNVHYQLDSQRGVIRLIEHPLWHTEGTWRTTDVDEMLYKGRVKHPQCIRFVCLCNAVMGEPDVVESDPFDWS